MTFNEFYKFAHENNIKKSRYNMFNLTNFTSALNDMGVKVLIPFDDFLFGYLKENMI